MRTAPPPAPAPAPPASLGASDRWPAGVIFSLVLLLVLAAYWPALRGDFLWDDAGHVTSPALQNAAGLLRIWFEPGATQQYYPLLHSAFWLEHQLWGDAPLGYHLVNLLWHATAATLFVLLLRRLALRGALLAGLIFALHPVGVESVAWISEQKNTLSLVLALAAALAWLRYEEDRRPGRYATATAWFVAALLTKTVTATLPPALLVLAWWRRGRLAWRTDLLPLLPWLGLGLLAGLGTAWLESTQIGATGGDFSLGPLERTLLAGRIVWFYAGKLLWPADLTFFYPRWSVDAAVAWQWLFPAAALGLLAVTAAWRRRHRGPLAAALLYGGILFPVLGFVNVYPFIFSYVADHFQYHACLAPIACLTAAAVHVWNRRPRPRRLALILIAALLAALGTLTWRQSTAYRDVFSLYQTTLARNPDSWVAHLNLGTALDDAGRPDEALPHLQRANALKPDFPETLNTLANVLSRLGRAPEALPLIERAVQLRPRFPAAHNTRGVILMALGRTADGTAAFRRALELDPALTLARVNLAWALANSGQPAEALRQLDQARRLAPDDAGIEHKSALVHAMAGRPDLAEPHARRAVALQPGDPDLLCLHGLLLLELGRPAESAAAFDTALRFAPGHPNALQGLQEASRRLGR